MNPTECFDRWEQGRFCGRSEISRNRDPYRGLHIPLHLPWAKVESHSS